MVLTPTVYRELRYKAIIAVSWITAAYPVEVRCLRRSDIKLCEDGSVIIKRMNSIGRADHATIACRVPPNGGSAETCIATIIRAWIKASKPRAGDLLFPLKRNNCIKPGYADAASNGYTVVAVPLAKAMKKAQLPPGLYSPTSLRLGFIAHCKSKGASDYEMCVRTGYKSVFALRKATRHFIDWDAKSVL